MLTHKIKQIRKAKGYSQDDMADHLGISPGTYGKLERGETKLDLDRLKAIADFLDTDLIELLNNNSVVITYNDHNKTVRDHAISSMYSEHHDNEKAIEALEKVIEHLKEEVLSLRDEKKQMLSLIEKLSQQG